jgi:hypothetical protein
VDYTGIIASEPGFLGSTGVLIAALIAAVLYVISCGLQLHHLSIYSTTSAGAVTDQDAPAIADPAVTLVNGHPIFPVPVVTYWGHAFGSTSLTRVKLTTPKLRAINNVNLMPLDVAATISSRPPIVEWFHHPLALNPIDENQILVSGSAALTIANVAIAFGDGNFNVPQGDMFTVAATATITTVTSSWVTGAITLESPLPAGRYAVIGGTAFGTNAQYFNLVFPNQVWRPGALAYGTVAGINSRYFRWGNLGVWGEFETFALPQLSIQASAAAATAHTLFMDIVRIR